MTESLRRIALACRYASCVPLAVMIAIATADVVARYLFHSAVPDAAELSGMLLGLSISLSLAYVTMSGEQVRFDLLLQRLRGRGRAVVDVVNLLISAVIFLLIAWQAVRRVGDSYTSGEYVGAMEVPLWPAKAAFAFACGLTAAILVVALVTGLRRRDGASRSDPAAPRTEG